MPWTVTPPGATVSARMDWVDYAKGWCIVLVVMMHSTLGVEAALGRETWLHGVIEWARPFRMPDFFLVAGLFLARVIDRPWRDYLDRKVLHFAYFFVLWTLIQGLPKLILSGADAPSIARGLAVAFVDPLGALWFIYLLPIFFVATRLLRPAPPVAVLLCAAALQIIDPHTGSIVIDEFAGRFVYFYFGYRFAPEVFAFADAARSTIGKTAAGLLIWGVCNGFAVRAGDAALPGVSLLLGFLGCGAVVAFSALLARLGALPALRRLGGQSLPIYLAFFLPMALTRVALVKWGGIADGGAMALIVTAVAIGVPIYVRTAIRGTPLEFLFERPALLRLPPAGERRTPAHPEPSAAFRSPRAPGRSAP